MADPGSAQQPSQEELQAYLQQLQSAEPAEIVAQAFQILAMGAEVKIGRPDARVLIDSLAGLTQAAQQSLPQDLVSGMQNAVRQLQMAQVQGEQAQAGASADSEQEQPGAAAGAQQPAGGRPEPGAPDARQQPQGPPAGGRQQGGQGGPTGQGGQSMTDRLWIPGR